MKKLKKSKILVLCALVFACALTLSSCLDFLGCRHESCEWVTEKEPSKTEAGFKNNVCTSCGEIVESEKIPRIEWSEEEIIAALKDSVFKVYAYGHDGESSFSQGSGFFIDEIGNFITNAHVVEGACSLKIQTADGKFYDVDKMYDYNYTGTDYAICHALIESSKPVKFSEELAVSDTVYALGYPNDASVLVTTDGEVVSVATKAQGVAYYSTGAAINSGSSGGILSNAYAEVVGITTCKFDEGYFGSLRYPDIKDAINKPRTEFKEPYQYFYTKDEADINGENMNEYFDISVKTVKALATKEIIYEVTVRLKESYLMYMPAIEESVKCKMKIEAICEYSDIFGNDKQQQGSRELEFTFESTRELIGGKGFNFHFSIPSDAWGEISASSNAELVSAVGTIVFYTDISTPDM